MLNKALFNFSWFQALSLSVLLLFIGVQLSCSSIPLGSLLKIASMDQSDLEQVLPEQVRARITLDEPAKLLTGNVRLVLKFEYSGDAVKQHEMMLSLIKQSAIKPTISWYSTTGARNQYEFELTTSAQLEFKQYQQDFARYGKPNRYYWTVYYFLDRASAPSDQLNLDLELKLAEKDNYFYLLKNAQIDINF